jgi:hypothetical protein
MASAYTSTPELTQPTETARYRVGVVLWKAHDGMAQAVAEALFELGHSALPFDCDGPVPTGVDVVFSQGPYGRFLQIPRRLSQLPPDQRPMLVHWNDEGLPDLRLPWTLMAAMGAWRSRVGRLVDSPNALLRALGERPPLAWLQRRMMRFSYLGDYHYAYRQGWLTLLVDFSKIYADLHSAHGLPTLAVPWGAARSWSADLGLERNIDVLWMGARAGRRRSQLLDRVRRELGHLGIDMYIADNEEHAFIFGDERTHILNRAKITLNLTRTWYDDNYLRFPIVMPNRSLIVSETLLPHCTDYVPGQHYVSAPVAKLAETIHYYLVHESERRRIVENAFQLVTTELTLTNSVGRIMAAVSQHPLAARRLQSAA